MNPEDFSCFYSGAEGWGSYRQKIAADTQSSEIEVKWGSLRVQKLALEVPAGVKAASVAVAIGAQSLDCAMNQEGRRVTVSLPQPVTIACDQTLSARLRW